MPASSAHRLDEPLEVLAPPRRPGCDRALARGEVGVGDRRAGDRPRDVVPSPSQCPQAPYGELNEKLRGASSSKRLAVARSGQVLAEDQRLGLGFVGCRRRREARSRSRRRPRRGPERVSIESVRRRSMPSRRTNRSTTTSMCGSRSGRGRAARQIGRARRARRRRSPGRSPGSRGRPGGSRRCPSSRGRRGPGPGTASRPGSCRTRSTICWGVWRTSLARLGIVGDADAGVEQAQVVVDLGDRADGRAGVAAARFWSIEMAGDRPSMKSTSGLSIWPRNWRA